VIEPVFGAGAFAAGGHRLEQWLDTQSPEAMSFFLAWMRCQAVVRDTDVRGPLDDEPRQAGVTRDDAHATPRNDAVGPSRPRHNKAQQHGMGRTDWLTDLPAAGLGWPLR